MRHVEGNIYVKPGRQRAARQSVWLKARAEPVSYTHLDVYKRPGLGSTTLSGLVLELSRGQERGRASAAVQLADVLGTVVGIAAATAAFGVWHTTGAHRGFVSVWIGLAALGALGIVSAARCASETSRSGDDVPHRSL